MQQINGIPILKSTSNLGYFSLITRKDTGSFSGVLKTYSFSNLFEDQLNGPQRAETSKYCYYFGNIII